MRPPAHTLRLLVVDGSETERQATVRALRQGLPDVRVWEVASQEEWERALAEGPLDLVILDERLPWEDGLGLLRAVHARQPGVPTLMLTTLTGEDVALRAVHEGLEEFLPKTPESLVQLPRVVRFTVERARQHAALRHEREALRRERELLRMVLHGVHHHAIFLVDLEGRIASWNTGSEVVTGYTAEQALGRPLSAFAGPGEDITRGERLLREAAAHGHATGEGWRRRRDGSSFWADMTVSALHAEDGSPRGYVWVVRDATERKHTEEFRERLLGVVGHDLRAPLQAILLQAQRLSRPPTTPETLARASERMQLSAERMKRLISDLLDITRARLGGGIPVERQSLDLSTVVRQVVEELELGAGSARITLRTQGEGQGNFDPERMAQVVQNLVANALKYGQPGGRVTVRVDGREDRVEFSVHNTGTPIPAELRPSLFDPFRRGVGHLDTGRFQRGLGLGLYISDEIVRAHGGRIDVESTQEAGTTFRVHLPRRTPPAASSPETAAPEERER